MSSDDNKFCAGCGLRLVSTLKACPSGGQCEYAGPFAFALNAGLEYWAAWARDNAYAPRAEPEAKVGEDEPINL